MAAVAKNAEPVATKIPEVDPGSVMVNQAGQCFREMVVRLPKEASLDDLKENLWRRVQASRNALVRMDRLHIISWDESWVAECIVAHADSGKAVLTTPRVTKMPERYDRLYSDETVKVEWSGAGYDVIRLSDRTKISGPWANTALAERAAMQFHKKVVT